MKPLISTFLLFIAISFHSNAQETILLKGRIMANSLNGAPIHILNLNKMPGTTNLPSGEFEITVSLHDTISFSSIQFKEQENVITKQIMEEGYLIVKLTERINDLEEVYLSNLSLTGNMKVDISNLKVFNQAFLDFLLPPASARRNAGLNRQKLELKIIYLIP